MSRNDAKYYWCIKVTEEICSEKEIYLLADSLEVVGDTLIFKKHDLIIFSIIKPFWTCVFSASLIDGSAYYVEHWKGEIDRGENRL